MTYGFTGASPVQKLVKAANVADPNRTSAENIEALAALPLMHQPGEVWEYGLSTDVLGRVVEIVEGASLGEVLQHRLFGPLGMVDTAFYTPESKLSRRADPFSFDFMTAAGADTRASTSPPKFESGGGGLMSTLADYTRFVAMLSCGGALDGVRILGPRTLAFMASDHLDASVRKGHYLLWPGHGFGLGFAVRTDPGQAPTAGSVGEFFWGGMMGTAFWVSPRDSLFADPHGSDAGEPRIFPRAVPQSGQRRDRVKDRWDAAHHTPMFAADAHGSAGAFGSPFWMSSIEMLSGVRMKAMWPSRGGRLMVTPAFWSLAQSA